MIIVQDTREQTPLRFSDAVEVEVATVNLGDYTIKGLEDQIAIERKTLSDLLGSLTNGRDRFRRELRALRAMRFAAIVIEADWPTILAGDYRSRMHPNAVIGSLMSFVTGYGLQVIMAHDHATAAVLVEKILTLYAKEIERDFKLLTKGGET